MTFASTVADVGFLAGRGLFAVAVGYFAVGNLRDLQGAIAYADSKGAPLASVTVPVGSGMLLAGALSILFGVYPVIGVLAIVAFLVPVTALMHDFWNAKDQQADNEQVHFLKNVGLLGAALLLVTLTTVEWPYALGVTL